MPSGRPKLKTLQPRVASAPPRLKTIQAGSWRFSGQSSTARGYGYKWQQAREGYLRLHPLCVMCDAAGRVTAATVVDHSIPHRGDMTLFWQDEHWQALCKPHHDSEAQRRDNAMG